MALLLVLLLLSVPIAELWVIVRVAQGIGVLETLGVLILISITGAFLLKQQGMATWRRLQASMSRGEVPTKEATDGALILFGGALLLTPGFLTDVVGILLLLPPTRAAIKGIVRRHLARRAERMMPGRGVYTARVVRVDRGEPGVTRSEETLSRTLPRGEADSPDRE